MKKTNCLAILTLAFVLALEPLQAQVPQLINYGGRVTVGTVNFDGSGQFKFAFVNADGTTTFWSNDGTSTGGSEPTAAVTLPVAKGLYSVLLGNATLPNMTIVPATVFNNSDVRLRVWFSDGMSGFQLMTPDQRIAAVGYAMMAATAQSATTVADGAITSAKIASGAVGSAQLAADAGASANTASAIVKRDANGGFAAGTITATAFSGNGAGLTGIRGVIPWAVVPGTSRQAAANIGYIVTNATQATITLPASPAVGDVIRVTGAGAGGWKIVQNAGQSVPSFALSTTGFFPKESSRDWRCVASSSDGTKLVAGVSGGYGGQIYTSTDSGATWTAREQVRYWRSVASSSDGTKLVAVTGEGGQIYIYNESTTVGATGYLTGPQFSAIELQYVGNGQFMPLSSAGTITPF